MLHFLICFPCQVLAISSPTCESALPRFGFHGVRPCLTGSNSSLPSRKASSVHPLQERVILSVTSGIRPSVQGPSLASPPITGRISDFGVHGMPLTGWRLSSRLSLSHDSLSAMPVALMGRLELPPALRYPKRRVPITMRSGTQGVLWTQRDSNPRQLPCKRRTLPTELYVQNAGGF